VTLTTHPIQCPGQELAGAILPLRLCGCMACIGQFYFTLLTEILSKNLKGINQLEDLDTDKRILIWILQTGLDWTNLAYDSDRYVQINKFLGCIKRGEFLDLIRDY
jgi:hypothetical protein